MIFRSSEQEAIADAKKDVTSLMELFEAYNPAEYNPEAAVAVIDYDPHAYREPSSDPAIEENSSDTPLVSAKAKTIRQH